MRRIALLAGATGLVGRELLSLLLDDADVAEVVVLTRRLLPTPHPKLQQGVVDFRRLHEFALPQIDDYYCCLGTTIKAAGSPAAFRTVDLEYPATIARMAQDAGATRCFVVSAMGADPQSRFFYSRVKGEVEAALARMPFEAVYAFRPALIAGGRTEFRAGERIALALAKPLGFLAPARYRPIAAEDVARAMLACGRRDATGRFVILGDEMRRIAAEIRFPDTIARAAMDA